MRYRASGSARVLHPAVVAAVADAAGFRSTDIAQSRNVRITGGPSVNISIVIAPRATSQAGKGLERNAKANPHTVDQPLKCDRDHEPVRFGMS
ncbi:hypothetical protein [Bradyrhizobium sp. WSM1253]|uniref:hypothetical protein n=1 Tax=Bradyrhizobium sp. WSM1253 TaxID=319003 RepID=UPI00056A4E5C|nr:hypothetical protein [Bradyrhizobium sp. WSM1253]